MAEQPNIETVPFEAVIGPNSLPIGGMESTRSEYRTAPQVTHRTLRWTIRADKGPRGSSATLPGLSEDAAADDGGPPVVRKRRPDIHLFVSRAVDGGWEVLGL